MLTRTRLVVLVVLFVVVAAVIATFTLLPRHYWRTEQPSGIAVFWRDDEAFVFVGHNGMGRTTNAVLDRLPKSVGWWTAFTAMYADWRPFGRDTTAYRVGGGGLERYELANTVMAPAWDLQDGRLVAMSRRPTDKAQGYRWTGSGFDRLAVGVVAPSPSPGASASPPATGSRTLEADDAKEGEDEEEDWDTGLGGFGPVSPPAKERLRAGGWHYKHLSGYEGIRQPATLPIPLRGGDVHLTLRTQPMTDIYLSHQTTIELTGERLSPRTQVLFGSAGWREIPRAEYEARSAAGPFQERGRSFPASALVLLLLWLGLLILKFGGVAGGILPFLGLKRRLVKGIATTMSFPPAIPEQFPGLDRAGLDTFSRDLEGLGFEKLIDTAPVTDSPTHPPSFARVFGHRRHACFGVLLQMFPQSGGGGGELRCLMSSTLDDGWSVGVSNGKPLAASALVRRPRAIGMAFPGLPPADLITRFLAFRDRVCADLGLRPSADTSLAEYIRQTQASLVEIADAMKKKNIAVGLGQYYSRQMRLASKKSLNVWLGDYPKIAEERRVTGLGPGFTGADLYESSDRPPAR